MDLSHNIVLVTGGSSGIGLGLAQRFLNAGSDVIICGRREEKLREVQRSDPRLHIRQCDVGQAAHRIDLAGWVTREFPRLNVLVNNAGIQRYPRLDAVADWGAVDEEMAINFAPDRRVPRGHHAAPRGRRDRGGVWICAAIEPRLPRDPQRDLPAHEPAAPAAPVYAGPQYA